MRFLDGYHEGCLRGHLRKDLDLSIPFVSSVNSKAKTLPEPDPIEEVMSASLLETSQPDLEEDAKDFIQEAELDEPLDLNGSKPPPKPSMELKPLPSGLKYTFLNGDGETPIIISDQLLEEKSIKHIAILENTALS